MWNDVVSTISRLRLRAAAPIASCAILILATPPLHGQHDREFEGGGAIIFQEQGVTVRIGGAGIAAPQRIPSDEELRKVELSKELLAHVALLDHGQYKKREEAMNALIEMPGDNRPLYALLARSSEFDLTPEQHGRIMAILRERIMSTPGGAIGISMSRQPIFRDGRFEIEVTDLIPGLPAIDVLRVGDRIVALDGEPFQSQNDLPARVQLRRPGEIVTLSIVRPERDENGRFVIDEEAGMMLDELDVPLELGSTEHLRDPEGRPQINPQIAEQRRQEVREAERRFGREPVAIELEGQLPDPPAARRVFDAERDRAAPVQPRREALADALFQTIMADDEDLAVRLIEHGVPVNAMDERGVSALHFAARATMPNLARRLLEGGAQIDAAIPGGFKPIHWAARAGASGRPNAAETIDVLIEFGADINAPAAGGTLPITYAIQLQNDEWREFLISRGAKVE